MVSIQLTAFCVAAMVFFTYRTLDIDAPADGHRWTALCQCPHQPNQLNQPYNPLDSEADRTKIFRHADEAVQWLETF